MMFHRKKHSENMDNNLKEDSESLNRKEIIIIVSVTAIILVALYFAKVHYDNKLFNGHVVGNNNINNMNQNNGGQKGNSNLKEIASVASKDFVVKNGNFSLGLKYWASDEGMKSGGAEKGKWQIIKDDCHSGYCLNMSCKTPSCRLLYLPSSEIFGKINNLNQKSFLLIPKDSKKIVFSFWYKGCNTANIWLQTFDNYGMMITSNGGQVPPCSKQWREISYDVYPKENSKYFYFEITENQNTNDFLIDDISVKALK